MERIPLPVNLRQYLGNGIRFPIPIQNLRLAQLGRGEYSFYHRERASFRGIPQFSVETAVSCKRFYPRFQRVLTLEEYFFVRYGISLACPNDPLVFFIRVIDEMHEIDSTNLFPQELVAIE